MTAPRRKPWMKFYPADWQSDEGLRSCSLAARGLWVEMLAIMHKAEPVGHMLVSDRAPPTRVLAILCGATVKDTERALAELEDAGVFSRNEAGVIYSRRMVRDEEKAAEDKANGSKGGHPALRGGLTPPVNPTVDGGDKAQRLEARINPPAPLAGGESTSTRRKARTSIPDGFPSAEHRAEQQAKARAAGANIDVGYQAERFMNWAKATDARYADWPATWRNWIAKAIADCQSSGQLALAPTADEKPDWPSRLRIWRSTEQWHHGTWGPSPGYPTCQCPPELLTEAERCGRGPERPS